MWAAKMAVSQNIGVPWIMCQQSDAPDPVINTCNSFYCDQFTPNSPTNPKIWTENWPGCFYVDQNEEFLEKGTQPTLLVDSKGHALHAFVNGKLQGSAYGSGWNISYQFRNPISLKKGKNEISLLSMTVGLSNAGPFYEWVPAGLTNVMIEGLKNGTSDLSSNTWTYKIGLQGEHLSIYKGDGLSSLKWVSTTEPPKQQPLTWYKAILDAPPGNEPVGLDMIHMGKGLAWLNGEEIGRSWPRTSSVYDGCVTECNYRGHFRPDKCNVGCGEPTQRWYHVPRSWFKRSGNILVIFEEKGGDPTQITFSKRKITSVCAHVSEDYPSTALQHWDKNKNDLYKSRPTLHLKCPVNTCISTVKFSSYGNPTGTCGSYSKGDCHDPDSASMIKKMCLDKTECDVELKGGNFNMGICSNITKKLAVEAICS